jgi:hypothetical protein
MVRIGPKGAARLPGEAGASHYLLVIGGVLVFEGERLPRFATAFTDESAALRAADEGVEALVLQFPISREETK